MIASVTQLRPNREPRPVTMERREAPCFEVVNPYGLVVFTAGSLDLAERHALRVPGLRVEIVERITRRTVIGGAR
jgi:hypothetical protein